MIMDRFYHPTLYIRGVYNETDENRIHTYFSGYGKIHHIKSYFEEGFAFVRMMSRKDAFRALVNYRLYKEDCPFIYVAWARHGNSLRVLKHHH